MHATKSQSKVNDPSYYGLFTKYSLMDDYGFMSGLLRRVARKLLPHVPDQGTVEYLLRGKGSPVEDILDTLDMETISDSYITDELYRSIVALCAKVVAFGLDRNIQSKYRKLGIDAVGFQQLPLQESIYRSMKSDDVAHLLSTLEQVAALIHALRNRKREIGINLHLTVVTRRILEYVTRIKLLVELHQNIISQHHWKLLLEDYKQYSKGKDSVRLFIQRHSDLLAFEVVEHTSSKGEKYIAESKKEYWSFFWKSVLGGGIIAVFALGKIKIDSLQYSQVQNALLFSINYAACFVLVKQLGGIIATKQPAMTASTIAKTVDKEDDLVLDGIEDVVYLVRSVFRSQFISLIGNFLTALLVACIISSLLTVLSLSVYSEAIRPAYLIKGVKPSLKLVSYAAVAGCFLALSGLISGYFDNKVVASQIAYRITHSKWWLKSKRIARFVEENAGALLGNISLGFFLGCTFLLSYVLPFSVDIRHIAFSSANVGYALMHETFTPRIVLISLSGVAIIGLTNFLVSFSITLLLALKSRGAGIRTLPLLIWSTIADFFKRPLEYVYFPDQKAENE